MLVLLSDLHLTDGTSGTTINPRAFQKFSKILLDVLGEKPRRDHIEKIELVLLGDIFDVIRSDLWLCRNNCHLPTPSAPGLPLMQSIRPGAPWKTIRKELSPGSSPGRKILRPWVS